MNIFFYSLGSIIAFCVLLIEDSNLSLLIMMSIGTIICIIWLGRLRNKESMSRFSQTDHNKK